MMAAKLERTRTPGIYKRGSRYVFRYRVSGVQRWETCRTLEDARRAKAARQADIARGEFHERSRVTLHEYIRAWIDRYQGRGRRGFRENTREEYRRLIEAYVLVHFPERLKLTEVTPSAIAGFVGWLCDAEKQGRALADGSVRNILAPLRACLATAVREGLIRTNPAREVDLPHRPNAEGSEHEDVRVLSRAELATLLALVPARWRLFFTFLASTGLRISEAIALRWQDVVLDGSRPHVKVRRALVKGKMGPPKSRHGRREVPIGFDLADALRRHRGASEWPADDDLVFPTGAGSPILPGNLRRRVLKPAAEEAGVSWVGFHSFRHTCASLLFAEGRNAVQVQRWLGHHSAAFTLSTYVHLMDGDLGEPLSVQGAHNVRPDATGSDGTTGAAEVLEPVL